MPCLIRTDLANHIHPRIRGLRVPRILAGYAKCTNEVTLAVVQREEKRGGDGECITQKHRPASEPHPI